MKALQRKIIRAEAKLERLRDQLSLARERRQKRNRYRVSTLSIAELRIMAKSDQQCTLLRTLRMELAARTAIENLPRELRT